MGYEADEEIYCFEQLNETQRDELKTSLNPLNLPKKQGWKEELAVVSGATYGNTGRGDDIPGLTLGLVMAVGAAGNTFFGLDAEVVVFTSGCKRLEDLKGRLCIVRVEPIPGSPQTEFVRWR